MYLVNVMTRAYVIVGSLNICHLIPFQRAGDWEGTQGGAVFLEMGNAGEAQLWFVYK